ncbi:hypothetical protein DL98DRAFT_103230 [Cadophora sp. DSE1049]|nr:hypothetical protein DL98DRAFT_103230 [Cadophora sp. DSE1049]
MGFHRYFSKVFINEVHEKLHQFLLRLQDFAYKSQFRTMFTCIASCVLPFVQTARLEGWFAAIQGEPILLAFFVLLLITVVVQGAAVFLHFRQEPHEAFRNPLPRTAKQLSLAIMNLPTWLIWSLGRKWVHIPARVRRGVEAGWHMFLVGVLISLLGRLISNHKEYNLYLLLFTLAPSSLAILWSIIVDEGSPRPQEDFLLPRHEHKRD